MKKTLIILNLFIFSQLFVNAEVQSLNDDVWNTTYVKHSKWMNIANENDFSNDTNFCIMVKVKGGDFIRYDAQLSAWKKIKINSFMVDKIEVPGSLYKNILVWAEKNNYNFPIQDLIKIPPHLLPFLLLELLIEQPLRLS